MIARNQQAECTYAYRDAVTLPGGCSRLASRAIDTRGLRIVALELASLARNTDGLILEIRVAPLEARGTRECSAWVISVSTNRARQAFESSICRERAHRALIATE